MVNNSTNDSDDDSDDHHHNEEKGGGETETEDFCFVCMCFNKSSEQKIWHFFFFSFLFVGAVVFL